MQSFLYLVHVYNANYFRDIPAGLLHLIPRGLVKHLLVQNVRQMNENRIKEMGCHLQSLSQNKTQISSNT